jgi:hypothetical protein
MKTSRCKEQTAGVRRIRSNGHAANNDWLDQFEQGNAA